MEHLLISDAAKRVQVESHVLRYWEEELKLPIKRNEVGHRYYTDVDIERFRQIKSMKERGLQLKAIKMILKDGKLDVLPMEEPRQVDVPAQENSGMAIEVVETKEVVIAEESKEEKAQRLQWLLKQLIKETLVENNKELSKEIRESVVKELDYQFRCQEERETERDKERDKRSEEYYQKMDALLRTKAGRIRKEKQEKQDKDPFRREKAKSGLWKTEKMKIEKSGPEDLEQLNKENVKKGVAKKVDKLLENVDVKCDKIAENAENKKGKLFKREGRKSSKPAKLVVFKKKRHLL